MKLDEIVELAKQKKRERRMKIDKIKKIARQQLEGKHNYNEEMNDKRFIHRLI